MSTTYNEQDFVMFAIHVPYHFKILSREIKIKQKLIIKTTWWVYILTIWLFDSNLVGFLQLWKSSPQGELLQTRGSMHGIRVFAVLNLFILSVKV